MNNLHRTFVVNSRRSVRHPTRFLTAFGLAMVLGASAMAGNAFFAMDTGTKDARHQTAEAQVAMIKDIGFDGIGPIYSTPQALQEMLAALDRHQLKLFAEYLPLDLEAPDPVSPQIKDSIAQLRGRDSILWLCVPVPPDKKLKPSDPSGDALAVPILQRIAGLAQQSGVRVALYPHAGLWIQRVDDAVRVARQVDRKNLGVTFNLCHWLMVDGKDLDARLEEARPWLFVVTINGADPTGHDWAHLIQPLDSGSFDVSRVLAKLKQMDYQGPIGLQHFGIPGDADKNLRRSMDGWRKLQSMLQNTASR
jgi:sugar phosphate isomerase/epimerase